MPKTQDITRERRRKEVRGLLKKYQEKSNTNNQRAGAAIRKTDRTYRNKLRRPDDFSLGELWDLLDKMHVPDEEREVILK